MIQLPLNIDYSTKVVVVTGAGGLICGTMARAFAQLGAKVAALDLNEEAVKKLADELKYEWSRIPHFYTSFYVYKYATGLISALAISNKILAGEKNAVENYKKFLSSGATLPPVELLKIAGVDLTNAQTFNEAFNFIDQILKEWEKI